MNFIKHLLSQQISLVFQKKSIFTFLGIIILGFLLPLLFNIYIFNGREPFGVALITYASTGFLSALLLCLALKFSLFGYVVLPVIALCVFTSYYLKSVFGLFVSYEVIASILETNYTEASAYITISNIFLIIVVLGLLFLLIYKGHALFSRQISVLHLVGLLILHVLLSCAVKKVNPLFPEYRTYSEDYYRGARYWPWTDVQLYMKKTKEYILHEGGACASIIHLLPLTSKQSSCHLNTEDELTIVLHIGESVRTDHLSINGYERDTTPLLKKRTSNIVSFPHNHSYGTFTRVSVIGILTDAECSHRVAHYPSFFDIFNHYGYTSISLLSSNDNVHDLPLKKLTSQCQQKHQIAPSPPQSPHLLSSSVEAFDKAHTTLSNKRQLFIIYDTGAHHPFTSLEHNKCWLPDDYNKNSPLSDIPNVINAYDNNLLEIDWEINEIITRIENKTSVYIYITDHGVSLGENNQFAQGHISPPVTNSAFFIWMSDSFIKKYPMMYEALRTNSSKKVSHDVLFHTILSLGGISSSAQKRDLDLTQKNVPDFIQMKNPQKMLEGLEKINEPQKIAGKNEANNQQ